MARPTHRFCLRLSVPKQWKLITLYMIAAYIAFMSAIHIAKRSVENEVAPAPVMQQTD